MNLLKFRSVIGIKGIDCASLANVSILEDEEDDEELEEEVEVEVESVDFDDDFFVDEPLFFFFPVSALHDVVVQRTRIKTNGRK